MGLNAERESTFCGRDQARVRVSGGHDLDDLLSGDYSRSVSREMMARGFVITSVLVGAMTVIGIGVGYRLNVTSSLPLGLYRIAPVTQPLWRGALVTFTLPATLRLHRLLGSFTKPVAGLPGDVVCVRGGHLFVEGVDYGPVLDEGPVHLFAEGTCVTVGEGEVFTASPTPRSYDSRYYGSIPLRALQASTPVWTW